jgi:hypothetical protein
MVGHVASKLSREKKQRELKIPSSHVPVKEQYNKVTVAVRRETKVHGGRLGEEEILVPK